MTMRELSAHQFQQNLEQEVSRQEGADFVVLGAEDWRSIEETLYLNGSPGLVESLHKAAQEPLEQGTTVADLDW